MTEPSDRDREMAREFVDGMIGDWAISDDGREKMAGVISHLTATARAEGAAAERARCAKIFEEQTDHYIHLTSELLAANNALLERARAAEAATVARDHLWRGWWHARRGRKSYDEPPDGPGKIGDLQWQILNDYSHPPAPLPEPPHD